MRTATGLLTLEEDRVAAVTAFVDRSLFARLGLPEALPLDTPLTAVTVG